MVSLCTLPVATNFCQKTYPGSGRIDENRRLVFVESLNIKT
jgi:hypothetical protein